MARYYNYDGLGAENLTPVPCAVCQCELGQDIGVDNGFHIQECPECGFVYVNPRPNEEQLARFYEGYYDPDAVVADKWELEMGDIFSECSEWIGEHQATGRVLDIGCSFGHFLRQMERLGWTAVGVEPSPVAAEHARTILSGEVHGGGFEDVELDRESFDAVVSLYVLEHVADPRGFVQKVFEILRPGGIAIIRIPYTRPLFPLQKALRRPLMYAPMHLNDFSPRSMVRLCRTIGFSDVEVRVGARRHAHDLVENVGARLLGGLGRAVEVVTSGRAIFPLVGALSYRMFK